jgi:hypothetical protein
MPKLFSLLGCSALVALSLAVTAPSARAARAVAEQVDVEHFVFTFLGIGLITDHVTGYWETTWSDPGRNGRLLIEKFSPSGGSSVLHNTLITTSSSGDISVYFTHSGPGLYKVTASVFDPTSNNVYASQSDQGECPDWTTIGPGGSGSGSN